MHVATSSLADTLIRQTDTLNGNSNLRACAKGLIIVVANFGNRCFPDLTIFT